MRMLLSAEACRKISDVLLYSQPLQFQIKLLPGDHSDGLINRLIEARESTGRQIKVMKGQTGYALSQACQMDDVRRAFGIYERQCQLGWMYRAACEAPAAAVRLSCEQASESIA